MRVSDPALVGEESEAICIDGVANTSLLKARACDTFPRWGVDAGQVKLFRVEGRERALAVEADPSLAADILTSANKLAADDRVEPDSWLLARCRRLPAP
jgi:hypothetical protein